MTKKTVTQYQAYSVATRTVGKTRQVVLLYDGMLRFMRQAKEAIREGRIEERCNLLIKVSDVLNGLQVCIDFNAGGEVAKTLHNFYVSMILRVHDVNLGLNKDREALCDAIIEDLRQMREVWVTIDKTLNPAGEQEGALADAESSPTSEKPEGVALSA